MFRTTVTVSNGVAIESNSKAVVYPEMTYGSAYAARQADFDNEQILPGVSESQDTFYREGNLDQPVSENASFTQPNTGTSVNNFTRKK
jgi:hypothetical protein